MLSKIYNLIFSVPETSDKSESVQTIKPSSDPLHPILVAVEAGDIAEIKSILSYDSSLAVLEAKDEMGNTPLILAASKNQTQIIKLLFEHGVNLETVGNSGYTALNVAAVTGQVDAAALLIALGAKLETRSETVAGPIEGGPTPLWSAVREHREDVVNLLIAAGANINVMDAAGNTVLAIAVYSGNMKIVHMLLEAGADPNKAAFGAMSAIERARANDQQDMLRVLEEKIDPVELVRQKRLQFRYFDGQSLYNPRPKEPSESTNNHLAVTRPTLM